MRGNLLVAASLAGLLALAGCAPFTSTGMGTAPVPPEFGTVSPAENVLVRFTSRETTVDVSITPGDPTAKDSLSLLPLTLPVEEFAV